MSHFTYMQIGVDAVKESEHPDNKIAANLVQKKHHGELITSLACTNFWPDPIKNKLGTQTRIGKASGTVHAETACLISATFATDGASVYVTDPPCPNCVKNMAEAGIANIYIDHKGFDKKWAKDRLEDFDKISLAICNQAGIGVHKIFRKKERIETLLEPDPEKRKKQDNGFKISAAKHGDFKKLVEQEQKHYETSSKAYAIALAHDPNGKPYIISSETHQWKHHGQGGDPEKSKYTFYVNPVKRVMMIAAREGLKIENGNLFSSRVPTAREMVDMVGYGITDFAIGNLDEARLKKDVEALNLLKENEVLTVRTKHPTKDAEGPQGPL